MVGMVVRMRKLAFFFFPFQFTKVDQKDIWDTLQIIDSFLDSVMSVCLTKTEIIAGSVDGTVRTFDIRMGRYVSSKMVMKLLVLCECYVAFICSSSPSQPLELTLFIHRSHYNS